MRRSSQGWTFKVRRRLAETMVGVAMLSRWQLQEQIDESGRGMEEDMVTTAAGMSSCGEGGGE